MELSVIVSDHSSKSGRHAWIRSWVLRPLFALLAIWLLYIALAGLDWSAFFASLLTVSRFWIAVTLVFELLALVARAARWSLLLSAESGRCLFIAFVGEAVGDLGNSFLPARAGEAARTVFVARQLGVSLPFVVGTAALERVSDAVFLALATFVLMLFVPALPTWLIAAAAVFLVLGLIAVAILLFLPVFSHVFASLARRMKLPRLLVHKIFDVLHGIGTGSRSLSHHPGRITAYTVMTAAIWILDAVAILCLAYALRDSLSFPQAMLFLAALGLSSAIPSTPGYIGIFQFIAVAVLVPFGISRTHALAIILIYQITTILQELLWGGLGWSALQYRVGSDVPPERKD